MSEDGMTSGPGRGMGERSIEDFWKQCWTMGLTMPLYFYSKMPWSGDVTQWIEAYGQAMGQIVQRQGMINVNYQNSGNPDTERMVSRKFSYGRQLGRILDVLGPLVQMNANNLLNAHAPDERISPEKLEDFLQMVSDVQKIKEDSKLKRSLN